MTASSSPAAPGGWVRRGGLTLLMVGALSVSVRGQVQAVEPLLGGMSIVLALTNDLAALLAMVLSHLVALVLEAAPPPERSSQAAGVASIPAATAGDPPRPPGLDATPTRPVVESPRAGQVTAGTLTGPGLHPALAVVPASRVLPPEAPRVAAASATTPAGRGSGVDPRVARLEAQLRAGLELTGAAAAELLGCSERTGRRLLRQAEDRRGIAAIRGTG